MAHPRGALRAVPAWVFDVIGLGLVLVVTVARSWASEDLGLYDETEYLAGGLDIRTGVLPGFTSGATYSDLYFLLSHLTDQPIDLYFVGRAAAAVLFVLGVWVAARLLSGPALAWVAAAVVAVMPAPFAWPGVSAPAAALLIVSVAMVFRRPGAASLGVAAGLVWLAAGARPELAWVAVVASVTAVVALVLPMRAQGGGRPHWQTNVAVGVGAVAVPCLLALLHGSPFGSGGREWVAFQQHFSLRHVSAGLDPWLDSAQITARTFPGASSLVDAVRINPSAFASHVLENLVQAPVVAYRDVMGMFAGGAPEPFVLAMFVSLLAGLVVSIALAPRSSLTRARGLAARIFTRRYLGSWIVLLAIVASALMSVGVVYPRFHYLLFPVAALVVLLVALQAHVGTQRLTALVPVFAVGLLFAVFSVQVARFAVSQADTPPPLATTARYLADSGREWRLLGDSRLLTVYVPNLTEVTDALPRSGEAFTDFLERARIDVVLGAAPSESLPWTSSPGFSEFLADPQRYGFAPVVDGAQVYVRSLASP